MTAGVLPSVRLPASRGSVLAASAAAVLLTLILVENRRRSAWKKSFNVPAMTSVAATAAGRAARMAAAQIDGLVSELHFGLLTMGFLSKFSRRQRGKVVQIVNILSNLSTPDLNSVLALVNVAKLVSVAGRRVVRVLANPDERLPCLTPVSRAIVLDALQKHEPAQKYQQAIASIFLHTFRSDLTLLKCLVDDGGDVHNLYKMIFTDITNMSLRHKILQHIVEQAAESSHQQAQALSRFARTERSRNKVLSDVDDTLVCSGGSFAAGCDTRFPKGVVYPGVLALFKELDYGAEFGEMDTVATLQVVTPSGALTSIAVDPEQTVRQVLERVQSTVGLSAQHQQLVLQSSSGVQPLCNLVFLSARPHAVGDLTEAVSYRLFAELRQQGRMHTTPTLLPGALVPGAWAVVQLIASHFSEPRISSSPTLKPWLPALDSLLGVAHGPWEAVGRQKFRTACLFAKLYPEYSFVFVGDNGQGDVLAAELLSENPHFHLKAAIIHQVQPKRLTLTSYGHLTMDQRRAKWRSKNILFVDTYVGAALKAYDHGLIHLHGLHRVATAAVDDFVKIVIKHPTLAEDSTAMRRLNDDLLAVNHILPPDRAVRLLTSEEFA